MFSPKYSFNGANVSWVKFFFLILRKYYLDFQSNVSLKLLTHFYRRLKILMYVLRLMEPLPPPINYRIRIPSKSVQKLYIEKFDQS